MSTTINPQDTLEQRSDDWHEQRKGMITGSRVAGILNITGAFNNRQAVMREMIRDALGFEREFKGNISTEWGVEHESDAIAAYEELMGTIVEEIGFIRHPTIPFLGASPDGLVGADGMVEVKCPYSRKIKSIEELPHYFAQIQLQLACADRAWCDFAVWTPNALHVERVERIPTWLHNNMMELQLFHQEHERILGTPDLQEHFINDIEEIVREDFEWTEAASQYSQLDAQIKQLQEKQKALKSELIELAGDRKTKGGGVTVFETKRKGSVNYTKLLDDHPEIDTNKYRGKDSSSWSVRVIG